MAMRKRILGALALLVSLRTTRAAAADWRSFPSETSPGVVLPQGLVLPALVPLPDGSTLALGGLTGNVGQLSAASANVRINLAVSPPTVSSLPALSAPRHGHSATLLPGGRVLVLGGVSSYPSGTPLSTAEVYDPGADTWTTIEGLGAARAFHTATALPDGRVVVIGGRGAGGSALASVEVFDPFSGKWSSLAPMTVNGIEQGRHEHTATLFDESRLLVAGGIRGGGALKDALLLDLTAPSGNPWSKVGDLPQNRAGHRAFLSRSGEVVVQGGCSEVPPLTVDQNVTCAGVAAPAFFRPTEKSWGSLEAPPNQLAEPAEGRAYLALRNGWLLVVGAETAQSTGKVSFLKAPGANASSPGDTAASLAGGWAWENDANTVMLPSGRRAFAGATIDARGRVLLVGGVGPEQTALGSFDVLDYRANGQPCPEDASKKPDPLSCASGQCAGEVGKQVCCDRRCDSVCESCLQADTNLGEDGVCGVHVARNQQPCDTSGKTCSNNSIDVGLCVGGACVSDFRDCGAYLCKNGQACPTTCALETEQQDCSSGHFCEQSQCVTERENGVACTRNEECQSGACIEGVCCDDKTLCGLPCYSCIEKNTGRSDGQCAPRLQGTKDERCDEPQGGECGRTGLCNEAGSCAYAPTSQTCGQSRCATLVGSVLQPFCDGQGACNDERQLSCLGLICEQQGGGGACKVKCEKDTDCTDGFACDVLSGACGKQCTSRNDCQSGFGCNQVTGRCTQVSVCLDETKFLDENGIEGSCLPNHRCVDSVGEQDANRCTRPCESSSDCLEGLFCDARGSCRAPLPPAEEDASCFCSQPGRPAAGLPSGWLLGALGVGVALRAARRRRACS